MSDINSFKSFVKDKPELIKYVHSGEKTWQQFYEDFSLYGNDEKVWSKYKQVPQQSSLTASGSFVEIMNMVKGINLNNLSKNISALQKGISLAQEFIKPDDAPKEEPYTPRAVFKRFED